MGFLKNDTTIIDFILSDEGRRRQGAGTFEVTKFGLSDDEIVYDKATQATPTAKFTSTPILEAVSENIRAHKYLLMSSRLDTTHLIGTLLVTDYTQEGHTQTSNQDYVAISTKATYDEQYGGVFIAPGAGFFKAYDRVDVASSENSWIYIDHGINDNTANSPYSYHETLPADLEETEVLVKLDWRIGRILIPNSDSGQELAPISRDDDHIATYLITRGQFGNAVGDRFWETLKLKESASPVKGARGRRLRLPVVAAPHINVGSNIIWSDLGTTEASFFPGGDTAKVISTVMTVQGMSTNLHIGVPLRFIKQ